MKYLVVIILFVSIVGCVKTMERTNPLDGKTLPLVTTNPISIFESTSAIGSGTVLKNGGLPISSKGIIWSTTANFPVLTIPKISNGSGDPTFTSSLSALTPATKYYYRAFAENLVGTAYGTELSFTTKSDTPYIVTTIPNPYLFNNTVTGGTVTAENGAPVTLRGLVYGIAPYPTRELSSIKDDTAKGAGAYTIKLTTLKPATTYFARAYAINSIGRSYGNQVIFTTPATTPTYTTLPASYQITTASSGGTFVSNGGSPVIDKGIVWSTSQIPSSTQITSITTNKISKGLGDNSFTADMTGLSPGTLYYVYAYATNAAGTSYGTEEKFTTNATLPNVNSGSVSSPGSNSVVISSIIVDNGGADITDFGHVYSTNAGSTLTSVGATKVSMYTAPLPSSNNFSITTTIKNLKANTKYYIRAYATNSKGYTGYGGDLTFTTTGSTPIVTVNQPSTAQISDVSAAVTGTITDNGGSSITAAGIYFSLTPGVSNLNTSIPDLTIPQSNISATLNNLTSNKTYYVKAYARNANGEAISSNEVSFTTLDNTPKLSISSGTLNNDTTLNITAKVNAQGLYSNSFVDTKGILLGTTATADLNTASFKSQSLGTGAGDMLYLFTGLKPGTTYYARAYASNNKAVTYGYSTGISYTTNIIAPRVVTYAPSGASSSGINISGEVLSDGGDPTTVAGFEWGVSSSNFNLGPSGTKGTGMGTFSYTIPTTSLVKGVTYYYRTYAKNSKSQVYGNVLSFTY